MKFSKNESGFDLVTALLSVSSDAMETMAKVLIEMTLLPVESNVRLEWKRLGERGNTYKCVDPHGDVLMVHATPRRVHLTQFREQRIPAADPIVFSISKSIQKKLFAAIKENENANYKRDGWTKTSEDCWARVGWDEKGGSVKPQSIEKPSNKVQVTTGYEWNEATDNSPHWGSVIEATYSYEHIREGEVFRGYLMRCYLGESTAWLVCKSRVTYPDPSRMRVCDFSYEGKVKVHKWRFPTPGPVA